MNKTQVFKAVYYPDYRQRRKKSKGLILAFGGRNMDLYRNVSKLQSGEIRRLLGAESYNELEEKAKTEGLPVNTYCLWLLRRLSDSAGSADTAIRERRNELPISDFVNRVIENDCLEVLPSLPPHSVDMILCDLPYGSTQNHWDSIIPLDKLWAEYERIIKPNGVVALTGQGVFTARLILSNLSMYKYKIVWVKSKPTNFLNAKKQPLRKHEDVCIFYKNQPPYNPQMSVGEPYNKGFRKDQFTGSYGEFKTVEVKSNGERYPTDVVYFKTAESEGEVFHPTQKPVELGRYLIRTFTHPDAIVLDNACGSGSFLVAAVLEGRKYVGIERNKDVLLHRRQPINYIDICTRRIKEAMAWRAEQLF